jgi:hypothetical protein
MPAHHAVPLARAVARTAMALEPSLPEALSLVGSIAAQYEYEWTAAEPLFGGARAHDPIAPRRVSQQRVSELCGPSRGSRCRGRLRC